MIDIEKEIVNDYINNTIKAYKQARNVFSRPDGYPIFRGRSKSISSEAEDLTAVMLYNLLSSKGIDVEIFVDQGISLKNAASSEKAKIFYPDILICAEKNSRKYCLYMCDMKMDSGWNRNGLPDIVRDHTEKLNMLTNSQYVKTVKSGVDKSVIDIDFSECLYYDIVYISKENGSKDFIKDFERLKVSSSSSVPFALTEGDHPNNYKREININQTSDFNNWLNRVYDCFKEQNK